MRRLVLRCLTVKRRSYGRNSTSALCFRTVRHRDEVVKEGPLRRAFLRLASKDCTRCSTWRVPSLCQALGKRSECSSYLVHLVVVYRACTHLSPSHALDELGQGFGLVR